MRPHPHTHPCATPSCAIRIPCGGTLERNVDGEPPIICTAYHLDGGSVQAVRCESCELLRCADCGEVAPLVECNLNPYGFAVLEPGLIRICATCLADRELVTAE